MPKFMKAPTAVLACALICAAAPPAQTRTQRRPARRTTQTKNTPPPRPVVIASRIDEPGYGEFTEHGYTNPFFGLQITFPEDWFILNRTGVKGAQEVGKQVLGVGQQEQQLIDNAVARTINLFAVTQYLSAPPGKTSPNLMGMAEVLPVINATPVLYLKAMSEGALPRLHINFEVEQEPRMETLGGRPFGLMTIKINTPTIVVRQTYYVAILKGHALVFVESYATEEQHNVLDAILATAKFTDAK